MKVKPLFHQLLIKPVEQKSVLVNPDNQFLMYGEVLDMGRELALQTDTPVKVGDVVAYTLWGLNHVEIEGKKHYLVPCHPDFLLGVITNEPEEK